MPLDPYQPCPGGIPKKIKFCCPDLVGELEKIEKLQASEQYAACLERIEHLEEKFPGRACLMSTKASMQTSLGQLEAAAQTLAKFSEAHPGNPVALAEAAVIKATEGQGQEGVRLMQEAIESAPEPWPPQLTAALLPLGQALAVQGHFPAALQHLAVDMSLHQAGEDDPGTQLISQLLSAGAISPLMRQFLRPKQSPAAGADPRKFAEAIQAAGRLRWHTSRAILEQLADATPDDAAVWYSLAVVRAWLADESGAAEAWRRYARFEIPFEEAVEAEALAQLLSGEFAENSIEEIERVYPIPQQDEVELRLSGDPRVVRLPWNPAGWNVELGPPPRAVYRLLDRPLPKSGKEISAEQVPEPIGEALLFGKQTDREARIEVAATRGDNLDRCAQLLKDLLGDLVGEAAEERPAGPVNLLGHILRPPVMFPEDTPAERRDAITVAELRRRLFEVLPQQPLKMFGERSLAQVAADQQGRVAAAALLKNLENAFPALTMKFEPGALREQLGLPPVEPIDPASLDLDRSALPQLTRLDFAKLDRDKLEEVFSRGVLQHAPTVAIPAARGLAARPDAKTRADALGYLARVEIDSGQALSYLEQAQQAADAAKQSSGPWDIMELSLRLRRGEPEHIERLLNHIQAAHGREPGVMQSLAQLLMELGLLRPDGSLAAPPPGAAEESAGIILPGGAPAAAEPGKLWTPGGEQPKREKASLWTPGMD